MESYNELVKLLSADSNLHFLLKEDDLAKALQSPIKTDIEMAFKKGILYANKTIILLPKIEELKHIDSQDQPISKERKAKLLNDPGFTNLPNVHKNLENLRQFNNAVYFIPEEVINYTERWSIDGYFTSGQRTVFDFRSEYKNNFGIDMSFNDPAIENHVFERLSKGKNQVPILNIWLPEIKNLPLDVMLKVREDEKKAFTKFQFVLKKFLADNDSLNSEEKLKSLFQYVDHEVINFQNEMEKILKTRKLRLYEAVLGFSIIGLSLFLPKEITELVTAVISGYQGKNLIEYLFKDQDQIYNKKISDFYLPWLIHDISSS